MNFSMQADHQDVFGRTIKSGDVIVTLDANYRSGASYALGIAVGSTAKMLKVASKHPWRQGHLDLSNRNLDKILIIDPASIQHAHLKDELRQVWELLGQEGYVADVA